MIKQSDKYIEHVLTVVGAAWHRAYKSETLCRRAVRTFATGLPGDAHPHCVRCYPHGHRPCS